MKDEMTVVILDQSNLKMKFERSLEGTLLKSSPPPSGRGMSMARSVLRTVAI
jgi:hypothetical protein